MKKFKSGDRVTCCFGDGAILHVHRNLAWVEHNDGSTGIINTDLLRMLPRFKAGDTVRSKIDGFCTVLAVSDGYCWVKFEGAMPATWRECDLEPVEGEQ